MKEVNEKQVDLEDSIAEVEGETEVTDTLVSETEVVAETPVEITEDEGIESFDL